MAEESSANSAPFYSDEEPAVLSAVENNAQVSENIPIEYSAEPQQYATDLNPTEASGVMPATDSFGGAGYEQVQEEAAPEPAEEEKAEEEEYYDEEEQSYPWITKQNNTLPIWNNRETMNLNSLVLENIRSSPYFKNDLYQLKTYHEVVDEIYYKVGHLEPWERGTRKTTGQTGMCGGVRGVGAGGVVSTPYCILYKLFTLRLTRKQLYGMINHSDSPYIRALGFMYIRYCQPPDSFWDWMEPYFDDEEEVDPKAGGGDKMTMGQLVRLFLQKIDWYATLFPRIPVPIQKDLDFKMRERTRQKFEQSRNAQRKDDFGEAERAAKMRSGGQESPADKSKRAGSASKRNSRDRNSRNRSAERSRHRSRSKDRSSRRSSRDRSRRRRSRSRDHHSSRKRSVSRDRDRSRRSDNRRSSKSPERKRQRSSSRSKDRWRRTSASKDRRRSTSKDRKRSSSKDRPSDKHSQIKSEDTAAKENGKSTKKERKKHSKHKKHKKHHKHRSSSKSRSQKAEEKKKENTTNESKTNSKD